MLPQCRNECIKSAFFLLLTSSLCNIGKDLWVNPTKLHWFHVNWNVIECLAFMVVPRMFLRNLWILAHWLSSQGLFFLSYTWGLFNFFLLLLLVLYDEGITLILTSVFCGRTTRCSSSCSEQDTSASFRTWEAALGAC